MPGVRFSLESSGQHQDHRIPQDQAQRDLLKRRSGLEFCGACPMDDLMSQMDDWAKETELMLSPPISMRIVYIPEIGLSCTYCDEKVSNVWAMEIFKQGRD